MVTVYGLDPNCKTKVQGHHPLTSFFYLHGDLDEMNGCDFASVENLPNKDHGTSKTLVTLVNGETIDARIVWWTYYLPKWSGATDKNKDFHKTMKGLIYLPTNKDDEKYAMRHYRKKSMDI